MINIQSALRTFPDILNLFYSPYNLVATVVHIESTQADMCIYTHSSKHRDAGQAKEIKKIATAVNVACQGNLPACHFGHVCHGFVSPGLEQRSPTFLRQGATTLIVGWFAARTSKNNNMWYT